MVREVFQRFGAAIEATLFLIPTICTSVDGGTQRRSSWVDLAGMFKVDELPDG